MKQAMRRFHLVRDQDVSGISGTGVVAEGVAFSTGWVALTWLTKVSSLCFYPAITDVEAIHGHGGATRIVWLDHDFPKEGNGTPSSPLPAAAHVHAGWSSADAGRAPGTGTTVYLPALWQAPSPSP